MNLNSEENISTESLGEILRQKRFLLDMTLEEIEEKTGIKGSFIKALEFGKFNELPAAVYVHGYLKSLAKVYGLEFSKLLKLYKEEQDLKLSVLQSAKEQSHGPLGTNIVVTPRSLTTVLVLLLFIIGGGYFVGQIKSVTAAPKLVIENPEPNEEIASSNLEVVGLTEPGSVVTINNQVVPIDAAGKFSQNLQMALGENEIIVRSLNRFNKYSEVKRRVIVAVPREPEVLGDKTEN